MARVLVVFGQMKGTDKLCMVLNKVVAPGEIQIHYCVGCETKLAGLCKGVKDMYTTDLEEWPDK